MVKFCLVVWFMLVFVSASHQSKDLFFEETPSEATQIVGLGDSVVIECKAGGRSSPTIRWLRNGIPIVKGHLNHPPRGGTGSPHADAEDLTSTRGRLYIDCVTAVDAAAIYSCVAETQTRQIVANTILRIESSGDLTTSKALECISRRLSSGIPARVYMWTAISLRHDGEDVLLACRSEGNPAPSVAWFDSNGNRIGHRAAGQYQVQANGDLLIRDITWSGNMGVYRCVVENAAGTHSVETFLYPLRREE